MRLLPARSEARHPRRDKHTEPGKQEIRTRNATALNCPAATAATNMYLKNFPDFTVLFHKLASNKYVLVIERMAGNCGKPLQLRAEMRAREEDAARRRSQMRNRLSLGVRGQVGGTCLARPPTVPTSGAPSACCNSTQLAGNLLTPLAIQYPASRRHQLAILFFNRLDQFLHRLGQPQPICFSSSAE